MRVGGRSTIGRFGALIAVTALVAACSGTAATEAPAESQAPEVTAAPSEAAEPGSFTYLCATGTFANAIKEAWVKPFTEQTGIEVICDERDPTPDLIKSAVETGDYAFDATLAFEGIPEADWPKYFEKLDLSQLPTDEIDAPWVTDYWVVTDIAAQIVAYNTDATRGVEVTGLADFFDLEKIPGKRCLPDYFATAYAWALMADGVAPDQLIPYDVERAQAKLKTLGDNIIWFSTGTQIQEYLTSGECPVGIAWNGRARAAANDGAPVKVVWNPQILTYDRTAILKGSPNYDAAMKFLAFMTSKEYSGDLTKYVPYVPANKLATIDAATADWAPRIDVPAFIPNYDYWDESFKEMDPGFQALKTGY